MVDFKLSKKADEDLANLYEYGIVNFGVEHAASYFLELNNKFQFIIENTELGKPADELFRGLRRMAFKSHVIFYLEQEDHILIVRVLRQEMDFYRHF